MLLKVVFLTLTATAYSSVLYPTLLTALDPHPTFLAPLDVASLRLPADDSDPSYSYSYSVDEPLTGDVKSQAESRKDGLVKGQYSLIQPDGIRRTVNYEADALRGFTAVVDNQPTTTEAPAASEEPRSRPVLAPAAPLVPPAPFARTLLLTHPVLPWPLRW